jgi:enoyl-CoA hydratase/carnithine racemase
MTPLIVERIDAITRLTLNRPEKANALDSAMVDQLLAAVEAASNDGTRLLVLAGSGTHFCAGFDFSLIETQSEGELLLRFVRIEQLLQALWYAPIATLALAQGSCLGAGADLICVCERRVAAPGTRFRMPGLRFGLALGTRRMAARVGAEAARHVLSTSAVFDVEQAQTMGFIDTVLAHTEWPALAQRLVNHASTLDPQARATLNRLTAGEARDADLAELVRSAAAPGLKTRIRAFLAAPA